MELRATEDAALAPLCALTEPTADSALLQQDAGRSQELFSEHSRFSRGPKAAITSQQAAAGECTRQGPPGRKRTSEKGFFLKQHCHQ